MNSSRIKKSNLYFENLPLQPYVNETHIDDPFLVTAVYSVQMTLLYLCLIFLMGAMVRHATDVLQIPVPYTVVVFFCGVIVGYLPIDEIIKLSPHTILYVFMPILIFEGAFAIDVYVFKQIFMQVLLLAGPALAVMVSLTAGLSVYLFKYEMWNWTFALLFGSILTATDPVAVVAIMKELGTNKRLALLIEGESMLNDGTAMVCYEIFLRMVSEPDMPFIHAVQQAVWITVGGPLFGYIMAKVAVFWLQWTFNDTLTEIAITLSVAYLVFYLADSYMAVSAVLGVVTLGVTLSEHRTSISPEVEMFLHSFWETLAFMANTLIFHICGFIISRRVIIVAELQDCIYMIILYFGLQVIRGITILMLSPVLQHLGYGLTWQDGLVTTWSGLRGAIGLALSLIIFNYFNFDPHLEQYSSVGSKILFHVSSIVVLSLLINGTTVSNLLAFLGLTDVTPARRNAMMKAVKILEEQRTKAMSVWKIDRFLADAEWEMIDRICTVEDPYMSTETMEEKELRERQGGTCPQCHIVVPYVPTQSEIHSMLAEATRKYLKLLKQHFWMQFERGLLTGYSVRKLIEMAEEAADRDCEMIRVNEIKGMWRVPPNLANMKYIISTNCVVFQVNDEKSYSVFYLTMCLLGESRHLLFAIYGMDTIIILLLVLSITTSHLYEPGQHTVVAVHNVTIVMCVFSSAYFIFRVIMFRLVYVKTVWFYLNILCLVCSYVEFTYMILNIIAWYQNIQNNLSIIPWIDYGRFGIMFFVLRGLRVLQLFEFGALVLLDLIKQNIRDRQTMGCDLARGFVRANEVAVRMVDDISDDTNVQYKIRTKAELATLSVLRELGFLQGVHPDVALGVKTSQAIRSVLNALREGMHHLIEEGGIDEPEGMLFVKVIESKMKRVMANPPRLLIPSPRKILESIPWIEGNQAVVDFILHLSERRSYHYGDQLMKIGDIADGIHFVVSGLVKAEVPLDSLKTASGSPSVRLLDFLSTGNVIGERSVMMEQPRKATLSCETIVETIFLSTEKLKLTLKTFSYLDPPLKHRIWRVIATKLALSILSNMPSYRGMRQDTILSQLEGAELVHLDSTDTFDITANMVDVILIVGKAKDTITKEMYIGPCHIPKNVIELSFTPDQVPTPLILYTEKTTVATTSTGGKLSLCIADQRASIYPETDIESARLGTLDTLNF
ncbi:hypothetical protein BsWGS_07090 [Bradybaena similaris]